MTRRAPGLWNGFSNDTCRLRNTDTPQNSRTRVGYRIGYGYFADTAGYVFETYPTKIQFLNNKRKSDTSPIPSRHAGIPPNPNQSFTSYKTPLSSGAPPYSRSHAPPYSRTSRHSSATRRCRAPSRGLAAAGAPSPSSLLGWIWRRHLPPWPAPSLLAWWTDEPELEKILEDLGALGLNEDAGPSEMMNGWMQSCRQLVGICLANAQQSFMHYHLSVIVLSLSWCRTLNPAIVLCNIYDRWTP